MVFTATNHPNYPNYSLTAVFIPMFPTFSSGRRTIENGWLAIRENEEKKGRSCCAVENAEPRMEKKCFVLYNFMVEGEGEGVGIQDHEIE